MMTATTLVKPRIHWNDNAKAGIEARGGAESAWFEEFDEVLSEMGVDEPLEVRSDADTWYFVNDIDVSFPVDPSAPLGLDTWDF